MIRITGILSVVVVAAACAGGGSTSTSTSAGVGGGSTASVASAASSTGGAGGAPCDVIGPICPLDHVCCGDACCPPWKMCCNAPGMAAPTCVARDAGACPTCAGCQ